MTKPEPTSVPTREPLLAPLSLPASPAPAQQPLGPVVRNAPPYFSPDAPEFGLLATVQDDLRLLGAQSSAGSAEALPYRPSSEVGVVELFAAYALAVVSGLLVRTWTGRRISRPATRRRR